MTRPATRKPNVGAIAASAVPTMNSDTATRKTVRMWQPPHHETTGRDQHGHGQQEAGRDPLSGARADPEAHDQRG
jgi:hypothetical protein